MQQKNNYTVCSRACNAEYRLLAREIRESPPPQNTESEVPQKNPSAQAMELAALRTIQSQKLAARNDSTTIRDVLNKNQPQTDTNPALKNSDSRTRTGKVNTERLDETNDDVSNNPILRGIEELRNNKVNGTKEIEKFRAIVNSQEGKLTANQLKAAMKELVAFLNESSKSGLDNLTSDQQFSALQDIRLVMNLMNTKPSPELESGSAQKFIQGQSEQLLRQDSRFTEKEKKAILERRSTQSRARAK